MVVDDFVQAQLELDPAMYLAFAQVDSDHRTALSGQTGEQSPIALEKLLERVDQRTLAEAAGSAQEVALARVDKVDDHAALGDVVVPDLANLVQVLDAQRQLETRQRGLGKPTRPRGCTAA